MGSKFSGLIPQDLFLLGFVKVQMTSQMHVHIVLVKSTTVTFSNASTPAAVSAAAEHASSSCLMNIQKKSPLELLLMRACLDTL